MYNVFILLQSNYGLAVCELTKQPEASDCYRKNRKLPTVTVMLGVSGVKKQRAKTAVKRQKNKKLSLSLSVKKCLFGWKHPYKHDKTRGHSFQWTGYICM